MKCIYHGAAVLAQRSANRSKNKVYYQFRWPGMVAQACHPSTLGRLRAGRSLEARKPGNQPGQHGETCLYQNINISWEWRWRAPVIPATQKAEAENHLNLRGGGELRSCHCTPAGADGAVGPSQKKKKKLETPSPSSRSRPPRFWIQLAQ